MSTKTTQEKLNIAQNYLKSGHPEKALRLLDEETHQPELENARGVCLLRLNKIDLALEVFKEIVFQNYICIPTTTPSLYKANYLTALLLKGNISIAMELEGTLNDNDNSHPYVVELKQLIRNFRHALPWYQRILCKVGIYPNKPLTLPFEPGGI
jgi:tetratricopeptide (TPR) repeat protein